MMDPHPTLAALLDQWRGLTEAEARGIASGNWPEVARCQEAKQRLQAFITPAADALACQDKNFGPAPPADGSLRQSLDRLIAHEQRNLQAVAAQLQAARSQKDALDRTWHNLHRMRCAYVPRRAQGWQSYS